MSTLSARQEWARHWSLPLLAMMGVAGSATFGYSSGVFMEVMTKEFGWSRAQFSAAFTVQMVLGLLVGPLIGRLIDRVGPRRIGLIGIFAFAASLSSLGLANGSSAQWWLLGAVQAIGTAMIASPMWLSAVIPRFHASRGLALAVSLAGVGVATAVWPILAALGIESIGWRATFPALAIGWAVLIFPFAWFILTDPPVQAAEPSAASIPAQGSYWAALRSRSFLFVTLAGGIFAGISYGMILHLVPLVQERGFSLSQAAGLTGIMGVFVIGGRLATGFLLDKLPTRPLSVAIFLLPIGVCLLLWLGAGNPFAPMAAAALLGLATGSEIDVVVFIISRRFGREIFASVFAVTLSFFSVLAASGPLLASALYDTYQSYDPYLIISIPLILLATILIAFVPAAPAATQGEGH